jgi:hypothetical protein
MAAVQLRNHTEGRACYDRKVAAAKTPMEAMRALKRRLSDIAYRQMIVGACAAATGPRHVGRLLAPAVAQPQHLRFGEVTSRAHHPRP